MSAEFLAMGGYAAYVWPAYGLAALVVTGLAVQSLASLKRRRAELAALESARRPRQAEAA